MHIRIVTFQLAGVTDAEYRARATAIAGSFRDWPGLRSKWWLSDPATATYGGVYLFDDRAAAESSRRTALHAGLVGNPAFTELTVREFDTLAEPTAITGAIPRRMGAECG